MVGCFLKMPIVTIFIPLPSYIYWIINGFFSGLIGAGATYFLHNLITPPDFEIGKDNEER